jgi:hypothetical protein
MTSLFAAVVVASGSANAADSRDMTQGSTPPPASAGATPDHDQGDQGEDGRGMQGGMMPGMGGMQGGMMPGTGGMNRGGMMPGMGGMNRGGMMPGMHGRGMGGMMGNEMMEGMGGMMGMMNGCPAMMGAGMTAPRLPPGNEKLQLKMQAEIMQKTGEILSRYADQIGDGK